MSVHHWGTGFLVAILLGCQAPSSEAHRKQPTESSIKIAAVDSTRPTLLVVPESLESGRRGQQEDSPFLDVDHGLRLDALIAEALENHPGLLAARARRESAEERAQRAGYLPDPRFTYGYFAERIETRTGPQRHRFGLSQTIPWFGTLSADSEVALAEAGIQRAELEATRQGVIRDVTQAYFDYGLLAQDIRVSEETFGWLQTLEPVVRLRIRTGGSQQDLLRLQLEIGQVENEHVSLRRQRHVRSARLLALLGRHENDLLPFPAAFEASRLDPTSTEHSLDRNPDIAALREHVRTAERRFDRANLSGYPDLTLGVEYIETGAAINPGVRGSGDDPILLTLGVTLPLWRGRYRAERRAARASVRASRASLEQRTQEVGVALADVLYRIDDAWRQIELHRGTLLPRARQSVEVALSDYRTGRSTLLEIIDSERSLLTLEHALWRSIAAHEHARADLEALIGEGGLR